MQDIIAVKAINYGGKKFNPGDKIPARPRDAKVLLALGKAKPSGPIVNVPKALPVKQAAIAQTIPTPAPAPAPAKAETPDNPPPTPEAAQETPPVEASDTQPRRYKRRDLTAEG
jgi:hypothetical protein